MSQYILYKDIQDRNDLGQKFYRCDVCDKIGLGFVVVVSTWHGDTRLTKIDYCDECYAQYTHNKLVSQDYERADREGRYTGD